MCVYTHTHTRIHMYIFIHVCVCVYTHTHTHKDIYLCIYVTTRFVPMWDVLSRRHLKT